VVSSPQNCGVLWEPPVKPQVRGGGKHPASRTLRFIANFRAIWWLPGRFFGFCVGCWGFDPFRVLLWPRRLLIYSGGWGW